MPLMSRAEGGTVASHIIRSSFLFGFWTICVYHFNYKCVCV